ncbi:DUF192 domain-containing protein [Patescibacteria group bacterium]|nr:DUF192 domain-containing protein [Patescibacteria group bacterium]
MQKIIAVAFVVIVPILFLIWYQVNLKTLLPQNVSSDELLTLQVNTAIIEVKLADTFQKRVQRLSERIALEKDSGLFFVFKESDFHSIWMKEMNFAIDIIWIDKNKSVIEITKNVDPKTFPEVFYPKEAVQYVIEIQAGFTELNEIQLGDKILGL